MEAPWQRHLASPSTQDTLTDQIKLNRPFFPSAKPQDSAAARQLHMMFTSPKIVFQDLLKDNCNFYIRKPPSFVQKMGGGSQTLTTLVL